MPSNKQPSPKTASQNKATNKLTANTKGEKPEQFEEQRNTALRMKPQPLGKVPAAKNKK